MQRTLLDFVVCIVKAGRASIRGGLLAGRRLSFVRSVVVDISTLAALYLSDVA